MSAFVLACVLCAAILHAGWNAVLRGGSDRLWSMTLMMIAVSSVTACTLVFVPWPNAASWPYVIASALIHTGYNFSLVRTYRSGDLGQTYPISRGSSPVLVALGAAVFAHETLNLVSSIGIALVSGGIFSLAFQGRRVRVDFLPAAFTTGVLIGAYTVVDGIGVRLSGNSLAYAASMFLLWSSTMPVLYYAMRGRRPNYTKAQTMMALTGGVVSIVAYGVVIWAMQYDAMGVVSALRETSVVFAWSDFSQRAAHDSPDHILSRDCRGWSMFGVLTGRTLVVSPFARRGFVDKTAYDTTSIIKLITP